MKQTFGDTALVDLVILGLDEPGEDIITVFSVLALAWLSPRKKAHGLSFTHEDAEYLFRKFVHDFQGARPPAVARRVEQAVPARTDERAASSIEAVGAEFFSALARELVEDVTRDDIQVFRDKKIAIEPFGAFAPLPMDLSAARSLNDRMLKALQETTNGPRRFYSINDLRDLADRIHRRDLGQREFEKELTSLLRRSRVDVVVIGTIRRPDDGFWISYRAVRRALSR